jgi:hypothetical protein
MHLLHTKSLYASTLFPCFSPRSEQTREPVVRSMNGCSTATIPVMNTQLRHLSDRTSRDVGAQERTSTPRCNRHFSFRGQSGHVVGGADRSFAAKWRFQEAKRERRVITCKRQCRRPSSAYSAACNNQNHGRISR